MKININKLKEELKTLISIPSYKDCDKIQTYLQNRLNYINFEKQYVGKDNLYNILSIKKPFLINTHVDTVPPMGMKNPFKPIEKDGKIFGRGAADTKGLIASLIIALDKFKEDFPDKEIPVSLAFTVDEEQNSALGSQKLVEKLDKIKSCVVLEPTYGEICTKQAGSLEFSLTVNLPSAHASEFEKFENPAKLAFKIITESEEKLSRPINIIKFRSGWDFYAVPKRADTLLEIKLNKHEVAEKLIPKIEDTVKNYKGKADFKVIDAENFLCFEEGDSYKYLKKAYETALGIPAKKGVMPSWTDASNISKVVKDCSIFGFGNLADCHTEREHISVEDLEKMAKVFYNLFSILTQPK